MSPSAKDKEIIRSLARQVAEIASHPLQEQKRDLWTRLNRLERVRPLIHVQAIAGDIWQEMIPDDQLQSSDDFCRAQERELRKKIYCWHHFRDDRVIDDVVACPIVIHGDIKSIGFGMKRDIEGPGKRPGSYAIKNAIEKESDIEKIETEPTLSVDWEETERRYERLCDLYGDTHRVEKRGRDFFWMPVMDEFIQWRGIEQMFTDLVDRPEWVHEALERITQGLLNNVLQHEKLNLLSPGNGNTRLGSGGYGWTDQLPQPDFDGEHVRLKDLWARCATQIFTEGISPEMHDEFAVRYEKRLLENFGLATYGCCEPLHNKMHYVRKIMNLRRVSMSPWVDIDVGAAELGRDFVYTHKPNPTIVSMEDWHPEMARDELRDAFKKTRENIVEVNLQDLHTVRNQPHRLTEWTEMALQLAEEYA